MPRRSVDWNVLFAGQPQGTAPTPHSHSTDVTGLLAQADQLVVLDDVDAIIKKSVQLARKEIGFARVGFFLYDEKTNAMLGTWGTNADGQLTDEHHVMYEFGDWDRLAYERATEGMSRWTSFEDAPFVVHDQEESRVVGRGTVACTPIYSPRSLLGMMFNNPGDPDASLDDRQQALGAILCSLLGSILDFSRVSSTGDTAVRRLSAAQESPQVVKAAQLVTRDPTLTGKDIAQAVGLSPSRLGRVFTEQMGMSLVDYRNRVRLDRFFSLVDQKGGNLLQAALDSGFGSYAQFHRVFREKYNANVTEFLTKRRKQPSRNK